MNNIDYFHSYAAAFVRGRLKNTLLSSAEDSALFDTPLKDLSDSQLCSLLDLGKQNELKLHKFKKSMGLSRVRSVLGILHGLQPTEVLDIGTGRGVFLWPFLSEFPTTPITCVDLSPIRVRDILAVRDGGITQINAVESDVAKLECDDNSFDVVTFLEALEHIPNPQEALNNVVRIARRSIVLSVPSHEDDNEEHIHLFDKGTMKLMLKIAGVENVNFQFVLNHMIAVATIPR